jgi:amino acid transporter
MKKTLTKICYLIIFTAYTAVDVPNPAKGFFTERFGTDIRSILTNILTLLIGLAGLVAVALIVWGGFQIATARGNDEIAKSGKKTLTNAIIGLLIIILAYVIVSVVVNAAFGTVKNGGGGGPPPTNDISA